MSFGVLGISELKLIRVDQSFWKIPCESIAGWKEKDSAIYLFVNFKFLINSHKLILQRKEPRYNEFGINRTWRLNYPKSG